MAIASPGTMGKHRGNRPLPGHFKVSGGRVEDRDYGRMSKQTLGKTKARLSRRAGRKTTLGEAPPEQRAKEPVVRPSTVPAKDAPGARQYARTSAARKRVKAAEAAVEAAAVRPRREPVDQPRYFGHSAVQMARRMARYAMAPFSLARAVVDRLRSPDDE